MSIDFRLRRLQSTRNYDRLSCNARRIISIFLCPDPFAIIEKKQMRVLKTLPLSQGDHSMYDTHTLVHFTHHTETHNTHPEHVSSVHGRVVHKTRKRFLCPTRCNGVLLYLDHTGVARQRRGRTLPTFLVNQGRGLRHSRSPFPRQR